MGQAVGIATFPYNSFHSIDTWTFSALDENYKL